MAFERRIPVLNFSGALSAGCTALDTTISSASFADPVNPLPVISAGSPQSYVPLVLANDSQGKMEVVYVTNHASGATTATVTRGREGTAAQPFNAGDVVRCAPTTYDYVPGFTRAGLPSDGFYGMRSYVTDENLIVERTSTGWNDSSPFKADAGRKHHWTRALISVSSGTTANSIVSLAAAGDHTGTIATISNGVVTLNRAGVWRLSWQAYVSSSLAGGVYLEIVWPNGPILGAPGTQAYRVSGGVSGGGNQLCRNEWAGYVNATQAAAALTPKAFQWNSSAVNLDMSFFFTAEYLGG